MVSEKSVLLVDAGNSRIKSLALADVKSRDPDVFQGTENFLSSLNTDFVTHIFFANVGKQEISENILAFCAQKNISCSEITTEKNAFGITNSYANEKKMGVDRWLAMLAAEEMTSLPFCVMDLGTAITCDFVANGQHLGGWIVPGFHMMQDALVKNTARVTAANEIPSEITLGTDTEKCVSAGCHAAVNGVYLSAIGYLASKQSKFAVIIGGGDKNMLAINVSADTILSANLVVHGLARYAKSQLFA